MPEKLNLNTVICRDPNPVTADMGGELVMMSMERGNYYALGEIGSQIWSKLESPQRVDRLCRELAEHYEVDRHTCETDVIEFLEQLYSEGLISINNNADNTEQVSTTAWSAPPTAS